MLSHFQYLVENKYLSLQQAVTTITSLLLEIKESMLPDNNKVEIDDLHEIKMKVKTLLVFFNRVVLE